MLSTCMDYLFWGHKADMGNYFPTTPMHDGQSSLSVICTQLLG
jgi:hypothetical protein